jgi:hypothetical protein
MKNIQFNLFSYSKNIFLEKKDKAVTNTDLQKESQFRKVTIELAMAFGLDIADSAKISQLRKKIEKWIQNPSKRIKANKRLVLALAKSSHPALRELAANNTIDLNTYKLLIKDSNPKVRLACVEFNPFWNRYIKNPRIFALQKARLINDPNLEIKESALRYLTEARIKSQKLCEKIYESIFTLRKRNIDSFLHKFVNYSNNISNKLLKKIYAHLKQHGSAWGDEERADRIANHPNVRSDLLIAMFDDGQAIRTIANSPKMPLKHLKDALQKKYLPPKEESMIKKIINFRENLIENISSKDKKIRYKTMSYLLKHGIKSQDIYRRMYENSQDLNNREKKDIHRTLVEKENNVPYAVLRDLYLNWKKVKDPPFNLFKKIASHPNVKKELLIIMLEDQNGFYGVINNKKLPLKYLIEALNNAKLGKWGRGDLESVIKERGSQIKG